MFKKFSFKNVVFCVAIGAKVQDPNAWLDYADDQMRGDRSHSEMSMTIETENWTRTLDIESDVEGKNEALTTINAPAKEKGIRTLRIENNMWNYFPKLKRKVAVSSSMLLASWMGSDFTNDDVLKASSMSKDYDHKFLADEKKDGVEYKVIENTAKSNTKVMWPKIITWAAKNDCIPRYNHYYDKQGKIKRTMAFTDVKKFDGHLVPAHWEMRPADDNKKKTIIKYSDINFHPKFKNGHFTQKNLTAN